MPYIRRLAAYNQYNGPDFAVDLALPDVPVTHLIVTGPNGSGKTALLRRVAEEVERYQKYKNYGRFVEVSREDGLIPGILQHGRIVSASTRPGFGESRRESVSISQFFTDLLWTTPVHSAFFEPDQFVAAYLPDDRKVRLNRVFGPGDLDLGPTLARKPAGKLFLQYLVDRKSAQVKADDLAEKQAYDHFFAVLERDLARLFDAPGLQLEFRAAPCELRFFQPGGRRRDFYRLPASHATLFFLLGEVLMRFAGAGMTDGSVDGSGVFIIDELDAHLHPTAQGRILPFLTRRFPRLQFIVATHSPAVVGSVDSAVVIDLARAHKPVPSSEWRARGAAR